MENEKKLVVDIITEAFDDNKSVNYVIKQDRSRVSRIRGLITYSYNICKKYGAVFVNKDKNAVAMINLPHKKKFFLFSISQDVRLILKTIGVVNLPNVLRRESVIKSNHPAMPFCHLWYIGVSKKDQGKGIGTELLKKVISKYEELHLPIYLETSMEENVSWYVKHDFEVYNEIKDFGFTTYMIRRPSSK